MRHFTALILIFGLFVINFGQQTQPKTTKSKTKRNVSKVKPKPKTKITIIEAATKDGKPVTLKSNGTWEYTKIETEKKPSPTPTVTPTPNASPSPTPIPTPNIAVKPTKPVESKSCQLTLKDSPVIRGLQLGMPRNEADAIIPLDRVTILNSSAISAYPQYSKPSGFENIYNITAQFSDEKLFDLEIIYAPSATEWKNAREFAASLSQNLKIPLRFWRFNAKTPNLSEMKCSDFSLKIDSALNEMRLQRTTPAQQTVQTNAENKKESKP